MKADLTGKPPGCRKRPKRLAGYLSTGKNFDVIEDGIVRHGPLNDVVVVSNPLPASHDEIQPFLGHPREALYAKGLARRMEVFAYHPFARKSPCPPLRLFRMKRAVESIIEIFAVPRYADPGKFDRLFAPMIQHNFAHSSSPPSIRYPFAPGKGKRLRLSHYQKSRRPFWTAAFAYCGTRTPFRRAKSRIVALSLREESRPIPRTSPRRCRGQPCPRPPGPRRLRAGSPSRHPPGRDPPAGSCRGPC